ncbi:MAG: ABC transporter permease, partial [Alphaproteobacteria bacterium]
MLDFLPEWLRNGLGEDATFWLGYLTNGKHLTWYASVQYTLAAAVFGMLAALAMGLLGAAARNSRAAPLRFIGGLY